MKLLTEISNIYIPFFLNDLDITDIAYCHYKYRMCPPVFLVTHKTLLILHCLAVIQYKEFSV